MNVTITRQSALLKPATFFHVRETSLPRGEIIAPGRWGQTVLRGGKEHPFFFREHLLEVWRKEKTNVSVSRFNCTFAFGNRQDAQDFAGTKDVILEVVPQNLHAPYTRLDMLWVTWMGEAGTTTEQIMSQCEGYWSGHAVSERKQGAKTSWEWLIGCSLVVK